MRQIILDEKELQDCIDACIDYADHYCEGNEQKKYLNELSEVNAETTTSGKWGKLIASEIFAIAIGEWEKLEGISLYVKD